MKNTSVIQCPRTWVYKCKMVKQPTTLSSVWSTKAMNMFMVKESIPTHMVVDATTRGVTFVLHALFKMKEQCGNSTNDMG